MRTITTDQLHEDLDLVVREVNEGLGPFFVTAESGKGVVILGEDNWAVIEWLLSILATRRAADSAAREAAEPVEDAARPEKSSPGDGVVWGVEVGEGECHDDAGKDDIYLRDTLAPWVAAQRCPFDASAINEVLVRYPTRKRARRLLDRAVELGLLSRYCPKEGVEPLYAAPDFDWRGFVEACREAARPRPTRSSSSDDYSNPLLDMIITGTFPLR